MNMRRPAVVDVYVALITMIGAALFFVSARELPTIAHPKEWGGLAVLALVASRFPLRVPGRDAWFSISDTFYMASALLFGPAPATLTVAIDSILMQKAFKTWNWRRLMFNSGGP